MPSDTPPGQPWWQRVLSAVLHLVTSPGWEGTLKVALLAIVFAGIYLGLQVVLRRWCCGCSHEGDVIARVTLGEPVDRLTRWQDDAASTFIELG